MGIENLSMLFGLTALAIPVLIHLLRRRRHDVVAWGAMQFLPTSTATRRRQFWDELPLMMLRMLTIALIVVALSGPYAAGTIFAPLSDRPARDVVIVLDGSYSMGRRDIHGQTPWEAARHWLRERVEQQGRSERMAILIARRPPHWWQAGLTGDRTRLLARIEELPAPRSNAGLPAALAEAWRLLQAQGAATEQEIVILTDRQHHGWADDATRRQWVSVGSYLEGEMNKRQASGHIVPQLRVLDVARGPSTPNRVLGPLGMSRGLIAASQSVKLTSTLAGHGPLPKRIRMAVDGEPTQNVPLPMKTDDAIPVPLAFTQRFDKPGLHVVTLTLESDGAADALSADDEQHAVVEVVAELPVLLVDGDREITSSTSTFFLDKALGGSRQHSVVVPRPVPAVELTAAHILGGRDGTRPRVVVLADVPQMTPAVEAAIETYLQEGGGVLVLLGPRLQAAMELYNQRLYRQGQGWLPARLAEVAGEVGGAGARPDAQTFRHPALELLRAAAGGFGQVVFPRWWKLKIDDKGAGAVIAGLGSGDPLLVERPYGKGRTILCSVPPDRGWESPLPGTWEFPVLIHELVYYLAGARARDWLLDDGQPLRVGPPASGAGTGRLIVVAPDVPARTVEVRDWPWTNADTGSIGLYSVEREDGSRQFFVVPPDLRESEDRRCSDEEWNGTLNLLPLRASTESGGLGESSPVWWLVLLAVMALLCVEVYLTRRLARARAPLAA
jgi:hypothetical protein